MWVSEEGVWCIDAIMKDLNVGMGKMELRFLQEEIEEIAWSLVCR